MNVVKVEQCGSHQFDLFIYFTGAGRKQAIQIRMEFDPKNFLNVPERHYLMLFLKSHKKLTQLHLLLQAPELNS